ncbi:MAG: T9SS type A sorting domain-containing protein [Bacteroidota bacterium]
MKKLYLLVLFCLPLSLSAQIYVDHSALGNDDGSSWQNAYTNLQEAINEAKNGQHIWVAAGTYYPSYTREDILNGINNGNGGGSPSKNATFYIHKDIEIFGGFAGTETARDQRDWEINPTILSGNYASNLKTYHVVYFENVADSCRIDGFTITDGEANNSLDFNNKGGGIFNHCDNGTSSPTIRSCIIENNSAFNGGGMYNLANNGTCTPIIRKCQFINNISSEDGGALYNDANSGTVSPIMINCDFVENHADNGGAIYNYGKEGTSSPSLDNCTFNLNEATNSGGAIYNLTEINGVTQPELFNCTFKNNKANYGGGLFDRSNQGDCSPVFTFCSFQDNEAVYHGGGVYDQSVGGTTSPQYINCYFDGNLAFLGAGMYTNNSGGSIYSSITNSVFQENRATDLGGAVYNKSVVGTSSPSFVNCTFSQNGAMNGGAGMYNTILFGICTPQISNSILWDQDPILNDATANPSVQNSIVRGTTLASGTTDGGSNFLNYDPLFVDEVNGDLRLKPCSPAVDNADVSAAPFNEDLDGNSRSVNSLDLGAFETQVPRVLLDNPSEVLTADAEYTDIDGWTHYFDCDNNILLLSLRKNGENIGSIGDGSFAVEIVTNGNYNSGQGIDLSTATYVETPGFAAMNRYWNVQPSTQPTAPVGVRFYYTLDDLKDLQGSDSRIADITKAFFFKVDNANNPHELNIPASDFHEYTYSSLASTTEWTAGNYQGFDFAEYQVNSFSGGGIGTGAKISSLPVELIHFSGKVEETAIALEWSTASERNTKGFNIEHSINGLDWEIIGHLRANGNTVVQQKYAYKHHHLNPGTHYYRLHIIDFDQYSEYSKTLSLAFDNEHFKADIYPNPMSERGTIEFYQTGDPLTAVRIYNMNGQELFAITEIEAGQNQIDLANPLLAGMYMVAFETEHQRLVRKLVVQKM